MTKTEFFEKIAKVPKAELHIHIEAVASMDTIKKLYKKRFGEAMSKEDQKALFSYEDLNGFIQAFLKVQDLFQSVDDFDLIFDDLKNYLVDNGITYCEAFFAPSAFIKKGFKYEDMVSVFNRNIKKIFDETGIAIRLMGDVSRTFGCENAMNNYNMFKANPSEYIIGIGLGGAEQKGPAKDFEPVYTLAHKDGMHAVAHAGEDVGPESIWDAINFLGAERIGHGLTAMQDEKLMDELARTRRPVEICITSNTFTKKIVTQAKDHPVKKYFDKGILVCINTDDPVFFKTTMLEELWLCYKELKFSMDEMKVLLKNSFEASFLSAEEKEAWYKKIDEAWNF